MQFLPNPLEEGMKEEAKHHEEAEVGKLAVAMRVTEEVLKEFTNFHFIN